MARQTHDEMSRLTGETRYRDGQTEPVYENTWGYDLVGNRKFEEHEDEYGTVTIRRMQYDDADRLYHEEIEVDGVLTTNIEYGWDPNGNLISKTVDGEATHYDCDFENRLTLVNLPPSDKYPDGAHVHFTYCEGCALGKLLSRKVVNPLA